MAAALANTWTVQYFPVTSKVCGEGELYFNTDSKVHVAHMRPTWVLLAPGGPHVGPMNLVIREPLEPKATPT